MAALAVSTIPRAVPIRPPAVLQSRNLTQRLPPDAIRNALSYLSPQEQAAFRATCRTAGFDILSVIEQACMNGKIHWELLRRLELISRIHFSSPLIFHVNLSWFRGNWTALLAKILADFPHLNSINVSWGGDAHFVSVERNSPDTHSIFSDIHLELIAHHMRDRLVAINLHSCSITERGLLSLGRNCPNIQSLDLGECRNFSYESLIEMGRLLSHLRHLTFPKTDIHSHEQALISFVRNSPSLESLDLFGSTYSQNAVIEVAENCPRLKHFCMGRLSLEDSIEMPTYQRMASKLLELESLTLDWHLPEGIDMTPLAGGFPRLHTVKVTYSTFTSSMRQIFRAFPRIRCLILKDSSRGLSDSDLPEEGCQLHELHLRSSSRLSQAAINRLFERSPSLQMLVVDENIWRRPATTTSASSLPILPSPITSSSSSSAPVAIPIGPPPRHGIKRKEANG